MKLSIFAQKIIARGTFILLLWGGISPGDGYAQDQLPVREYTNPDEVVTFDRTTPFPRAIDVINEFAQEFAGKIILDRTKTEGTLGISIPPMHWRDALNLILRVKELHLLEQPEFFEIVTPQMISPQQPEQRGTAQPQEGAAGQEGPIITTRTREVRINAIFFEGNRRALREIGVDWSTLTRDVPEDIQNFLGGQQGGNLPSTSFDNQFVSVNAVGAQSVSQNVFNSLINFGEIENTGIRVQALFSAFEADNLGDILASPSVKVIDGQPGRIQVGQDFSIKQRDFAGNVTDNFVSVGTILEVTPTIIELQDTTFIHLVIVAERSSAQPDPVSTIINKQEASTQTLLLDGEATAMAGLYRTETAEVRRGIPILKDLPGWFFGLKYLFGFNSKNQVMDELVILIQAELVPSIPERYAREHKNKFEILRDERDRMRDEIEERERVNAMDRDERSEATYPPEKPPREEPQIEEELPAEEPQTSEETVEEVPVPVKEPVLDPEISLKPIPIDMEIDEGEESTEEDTTSVQEQEEPAAEESPTTTSYSYYVIGGSFMVQENAQNFRDRLVKEGFDAEIITKNGGEFYYVAYRGYNDREIAVTALTDIRQYENSEAWLFEKTR